MSAYDPNVWSGRALQENFIELADVRSCINVSGLWLEPFVLRAIMGISARAISLADRPQQDHSGHQCSHAPGRPILHLVCDPLADLGRKGVSTIRVGSRGPNLAGLESSAMS